MSVGRILVNAENAFAVVLLFSPGHRSLVGQEGGALHEENRKGGKDAITDFIYGVLSRSYIGKFFNRVL